LDGIAFAATGKNLDPETRQVVVQNEVVNVPGFRGFHTHLVSFGMDFHCYRPCYLFSPSALSGSMLEARGRTFRPLSAKNRVLDRSEELTQVTENKDNSRFL
jgi:hypothetical protein